MAGKNKIVYGDRIFEGNQIKGGKVHLAMSLPSSKLEANTFSPIIRSDDSTLTDFARNAPLDYFFNGKKLGTFYVQDIVRTEKDLFTFSATSAIGLLIEGQHYGGIYTGETVEEVLPGIFGAIPYEIKSNLKGIALYGWLPVAAPRDNLSQVLFAIGAGVKTDMDGIVRIEGLWDGISGAIGKNRMYQGPKINYGSKVTQVSVTEHQYGEGGDLATLFEGTASQGDIITFSAPHYGLQATGFTVLESGANYAKLSSGSGTLQGRPYIHNTRQIVKAVSQADEPNIKTVKDATLVSLVNSNAVAERLANYYKNTQTIQYPAVFAGEMPGDLLSTWHPYEEILISACLESVDISLSNTLKAQEKSLVGFAPIAIEQTIIYEYSELISTNGVWTAPEGVTSVRAVLIGGGSGGGVGGDGTKGNAGLAAVAASSGGEGTGSPGAGGAGGASGTSGAGGNIYEVDISLDADNRNLTISIGAAGVGQTAAAAATKGGNTTISYNGKVYSSASGNPSDAGYHDIISGVIYAKKGANGIPGAAGGTGGEWNVGGANCKGEDIADTEFAATGGTGGQASSAAGPDFGIKYSYKSALDPDLVPQQTDGAVIVGYFSFSFDSATGKFKLSQYGSDTLVLGSHTSVYVYELDGDDLLVKYYNLLSRGPIRRYSPYATQSATAYTLYAGGGGGGGAAAGKAGGDGSTSTGGIGATAIKPLSPAVFGTGGTGGNGGGGGGGGGGRRAVTHAQYSGSATAPATSGGAGGSGSAGGDGAPGCVYLYYGVPKAITGGQFRDKSDRRFLDKHHRRFIV